MQIIQSQGNIVEKVLRDKEGRLVRARFQVYEVAGRIKARLIDFVYLDIKELAGKINSLIGLSSNLKSVLNTLKSYKKNSIFYSLFSNIYSIGSKPRAPTF